MNSGRKTEPFVGTDDDDDRLDRVVPPNQTWAASFIGNNFEKIFSLNVATARRGPTVPKKPSLKKTQMDVQSKEVCEYEKRAAEEGLVIQPELVKHMGNIDEIAQGRKEQLDKEVEVIKSDKEPSALMQKDKMKVRINEKNCVLYETNDALTLDEDFLADLY